MRLIEELDINEKRMLVDDMIAKKNGVLDMDWAELVNKYDLDIHPDTLRRASIGAVLASECEDTPNGYIERQKQRDLASKLNAMYRTESRSQLLRQTVEEAVKKLKPMVVGPFRYSVVPPDNDKSLVVALGDFHYGADINVKGLMGEDLNVFNTDVFNRRMTELLEQLIDIERSHAYGDIHLMFVGDLIDGILRQSQLMRLEFGLVDQTIGLAEYLATWINTMWQLLGQHHIFVHAVTGNHSEIRPLKAKAREFQQENLEKIIFWYLKERLKDNRWIEVDDSCDRMKMIGVQGYSFVLLHGDGENKIADIARNTVNLYGKPIDFFVCGHLHKVQDIPSGYTSDGNSEIIRVPSMCGMDGYAQSKGFGGHAGAIAMIIENEYGRRCTYPIKLL